ncbi:hypothetical protein H4S00_003506 [Coemansia sp. D1744]|nr:hypothetical protein GGH97_000281 [Coemansia sp. RSA 475]KAJ2410866.1 hypothetical protein J3F80_000222 [Coemansia sp. RSA 2526]KAJ2719380.1 hypothetical protein H4S00_003506 [Coemansia sp. D1744]
MPTIVDADTVLGNMHNADLFDFPVPPSQRADHSLGCEQDAPKALWQLRPSENADPCESTCAVSQTLGSSRINQYSRSTTSLPAFANHNVDGYYAGEDVSDDGSTPKTSRPYMQIRAAKSHHNLHCTEDNWQLSQSLLSLMSKGEQMPGVADLLSPIESRSCEFEQEGPPEEATLEAHAPESSIPPISRQHSQGQLLAANYPSVEPRSVEHPAVQLRKQISMAQLEARLSNCNSMVVSDMLFLGTDDTDSNMLAADQQQGTAKRRQSRFRLGLDFQLDEPFYRSSRYLYDVPNSPSSNGAQSTISRALQWSHRISQNSNRKLRRTNSSLVDQHTIYDIYEESIWHTARTPAASVNDGVAKSAPSFRVRLDSAFGLSGQRSLSTPKTLNKADVAGGGHASTRMHILRTVKSVGVPWNMIRSRKSRNVQDTNDNEWELSSNSSASIYNNIHSDCCSTFSNTDNNDSKKPKRKQSAIHLLVKRAGQGLVRRSASFYKSISGATLTTGSNSRSIDRERNSFTSFSSVPGDQPKTAEKEKPNIGNRFATAMRQAGNRLKGSLKQHNKSRLSIEDDGEVVSAYPADSLTGNELNAYLSMSALHSPVQPAPENSQESGDSDDSDGRGNSVLYAPPKQPPYLGLHRNDPTFSTADDNGYAADATSTLPQILTNSHYSGSTRLRPTQFNSPFTTLPYGTYAQHRNRYYHM